MKKGFLKIIWFLCCFLLVFTGLVCLLNPDIALKSIALLFGLTFLISGIFDIFAYFIYRKFPGMIWTLLEGILTTMFSLILLIHPLFIILSIPLIFTIWILFAGFSRIIYSFDCKRFEFSYWWLLFLIGLLLIGFGILSFFKPNIAILALSFMTGMIFISQGLSYFIKGYYFQKISKKH